MFRKLALSAVIACMLATSCQPAATQTPELKTDVQGRAVISDPSGLTVSIPPGGLYQDTEITIAEVDKPSDADEQTYVLPEGKVYEITASGDGSFAHPAEIGIPYDPALLPDNRSEDDIFPVTEIDGTWYPAEGRVDTENNIVYAVTLHNGLWSWATDIAGGLSDAFHDFFGEEAQNPQNLEEAYAYLQETENELVAAWVEGDMKIDTTVSLDELESFAVKQIKSQVIQRGLQITASAGELITEIGGGTGIFSIGGVEVGVVVSTASSVGVLGFQALTYAGLSIMTGRLLRDNIVAWGAYVRLERAYQRWQEAKAIVWALEHPDTLTFPPELQEYIQAYYAALPIDQTLGRPTQLDLTVSAYPKTDTYAIVVDTPVPAPTDYSDSESFLTELKRALENADLEAVDKLIPEPAQPVANSIDEYVFGFVAYYYEGQGATHEEVMDWVRDSSPFTGVDTSIRSEKLYDLLADPKPESDLYVTAQIEGRTEPFFLLIHRADNRYWWNGVLSVSCQSALGDPAMEQARKRFCEEIGVEQDIFEPDYASLDGFVQAAEVALRSDEPRLFRELLYSPVYIWGCASPGCGLGPIEVSRENFADYVWGTVRQYGIESITVSEQDVSCFPGMPVFARHTIAIETSYPDTFCLGFDYLDSRYYITEWWGTRQ